MVWQMEARRLHVGIVLCRRELLVEEVREKKRERREEKRVAFGDWGQARLPPTPKIAATHEFIGVHLLLPFHPAGRRHTTIVKVRK